MVTPNLQEIGYRRGLVLGFTTAEVMILLLFLMLLIMGFYLHKFEERDEDQIFEDESVEEILVAAKEDPTLIITALYANLKTEEEKSQSLTAQVDDYQQQLELNKNESTELRESKDKHAEELKLSREKYERATVLINQLQEDIHNLRDDREDFERSLELMFAQELEELEKAKTEVQATQIKNSELLADFKSQQTQLEEVKILTRQLQSENEELKSNQATLLDQVELVNTEAKNAELALFEAKKNNQQLTENLELAKAKVEILSENSESSNKENLATQTTISGLLKDLKSRQTQLDEYEQLVEQLKSDNASLQASVAKLGSGDDADRKGDFSHCWYKNVEESDGKLRRQALYLFHIQINDDFIYVVYPLEQLRKSTPNADTNISIEGIEQLLNDVGFNRNYLEIKLVNKEFESGFKNFSDLGEKVGSQECKFTVGIWDHTSPQNKKRYIEALEVVENTFYVYKYKEDKWPHRANPNLPGRIL